MFTLNLIGIINLSLPFPAMISLLVDFSFCFNFLHFSFQSWIYVRCSKVGARNWESVEIGKIASLSRTAIILDRNPGSSATVRIFCPLLKFFQMLIFCPLFRSWACLCPLINFWAARQPIDKPKLTLAMC